MVTMRHLVLFLLIIVGPLDLRGQLGIPFDLDTSLYEGDHSIINWISFSSDFSWYNIPPENSSANELLDRKCFGSIKYIHFNRGHDGLGYGLYLNYTRRLTTIEQEDAMGFYSDTVFTNFLMERGKQKIDPGLVFSKRWKRLDLTANVGVGLKQLDQVDNLQETDFEHVWQTDIYFGASINYFISITSNQRFRLKPGLSVFSHNLDHRLTSPEEDLINDVFQLGQGDQIKYVEMHPSIELLIQLSAPKKRSQKYFAIGYHYHRRAFHQVFDDRFISNHRFEASFALAF